MLASTHIGRVAQQVKKGQQMASGGSSWDIADFETVADDIDHKDDELSAKTPLEQESLNKVCHPYLISAGIEEGVKYIFTMNPLMYQLLSTSDFVEADITFNESLEYPYLFNMVAFDEVIMEWTTVLSAALEWINRILLLMLLHSRKLLMHAKENIQTLKLEKHCLVLSLTGVTQRLVD